MDLQFKGKRALVTGSTSDIGEGIAQERTVVVVHGCNKVQAKERARMHE